MKTTLTTFGCALALSWATTAMHAAGNKLAVTDVRAVVVGTPVIQAQIPGMTVAKRPRPILQGEPAPLWVEVETDFDCAEDFPELTVRYGLVVLVGNKAKLIQGETTLVDVGRGRERHSVMYISPKTLNRIAEGKPFAANQIKASWVEIFAQSEPVGAKFKSGSGLTYEGIQKEKEKGSIEQVAEALINKQFTPFAPLYWDYYETVKPGSK
jgi:hypothetical protein